MNRISSLKTLCISFGTLILFSGCIFWPHNKLISPEVTGKVVNTENDLPIKNAEVKVVYPEDYYNNSLRNGVSVMGITKTDSNGNFTIPGKYKTENIRSLVGGTVVIHGKVIIQAAGYKTIELDSSIMPGMGKPEKVDYGIIKLQKS